VALTLSPQQVEIMRVCQHESCHLIIEALAGTGKTTTILEALKVLPRGLKVAFVCFNRTIAQELQARVPRGVRAATLHSLGGQAVAAHTRRSIRDLLDQDKVAKMLPPMAAPAVRSATLKLVGLCKNTLTEPTNENLLGLAAEYGIELEESGKAIFSLVRMCLEKSKSDLTTIDFDDMIYLPVVLGLAVEKFDVLFVDESQDLNRVQQELILMAGTRIVLVGDKHQAIYRFRGADAHSMDNMRRMLEETGRETKVLPLTVTRRCPPAVVSLAQSIVPEFECTPELWQSWLVWQQRIEAARNAEENQEHALYELLANVPMELGEVVHGSSLEFMRSHMVLCRTNAPLVSAAYGLIANNVPVKIQGREFGADLAKLIKRLASPHDTVIELGTRMAEWRAKEQARLSADPTKAISNEAKLQVLADKCDCIDALCQGMETVQQVLDRIQLIFADVQVGTDKTKFVLMSSVHRAKGLEAHIVHIIEPGLMPHPMATADDEIVQEMNLKYVAYTRAISELHIH
jgi:DNA helicase II / ATP-dependent DNA helicase PcrA